MAPVSKALPTLFRWLFAILEGFAVFAAALVAIVILINPHLPAGAHLGPMNIDVLGHPGTLFLRPSNGDFDFTLTALRGSLTLFVAKAGGLIELLKRYGLPLTLMNLIFFAVLFDLLRRLFRNVGRGDSFTPQTIRLVQYLGGSLLVFSVVSAFAEHWFGEAAFAYLAGHTVVTVSGTALRLPEMGSTFFPHIHVLPFGSPIFYSGLLVLALSEVFRQGLVLKNENDLTV
jgi:hypothetical protein